ncbi:hypothetical protein EDC94DRAFT_354960 [Helicostylum pulchrum]|nr:hypothetical protein EDC94DRAFT_354960 [Helicostylum pulchrum]
MSLPSRSEINKRNCADFSSIFFAAKRRTVSKDHDDNNDIDPKLKRYLDTKFDAIDDKLEKFKETMLSAFEKQMKEVSKNFKTPNQLIVDEIETIHQNSIYAIQSSVNQCLTQVVKQIRQDPTAPESQTEDIFDPSTISYNHSSKINIRCAPLSDIIRSDHAQLAASDEGWDLNKTYTTRENQDVTKEMATRIMKENSFVIGSIRYAGGSELNEREKFALVRNKIKRHFANLRHEHTLSPKKTSQTLLSKTRNRRRNRRNLKLGRRMKCFEYYKREVMEKMADTLLSEEELSSALDNSLMSEEETDDESTSTECKRFLVQTPTYRSKALTEFFECLDGFGKSRPLKRIYVEQEAPDVHVAWMVDNLLPVKNETK